MHVSLTSGDSLAFGSCLQFLGFPPAFLHDFQNAVHASFPSTVDLSTVGMAKSSPHSSLQFFLKMQNTTHSVNDFIKKHGSTYNLVGERNDVQMEVIFQTL